MTKYKVKPLYKTTQFGVSI